MGEDASTGAGGPEDAARAHVSMLGPVSFVDVRGVRHALPSSSQRRLVALLAINPGVTLRAPQIQDRLGVQSGALRATVSRVRRLIGADALQTDAIGYRVDVTTDVALLAEKINAAIGDGTGGRAARALALERALAAWRGAVLDEFATEAWAAPTVVRYEELRCLGVEALATELIALGRVGEAATQLTEHVSTQPLRDRAQGLLMLALAGQGRQVDALRVYHRYHALLVDEVGTIPSAEVRALEGWIAQGCGAPPDAGWPSPGATPDGDDSGRARPVRTGWHERPTRPRLPPFRTSMIGRQPELSELLARVRDRSLVTLVGEGGVGKTRLAVGGAEAVADGDDALWFVELASLRDGDAVAGTIASAVGAPGVGDDGDLAAFIADRRALLVLDNCEHLLAEVAALVDLLLVRCPQLHVLATSREPLGIEGEHVLRLRPLDPRGAASELFLDRADAAGTRLQPDERDDVEHICRRLDGNPLAIELAAPRAAILGLRTVINGLDDRFALLADGRRGRTAQRRNLWSVVDWSYRLLSTSEQAVFRSLGVFAGGFELDAFEHLMARSGLDRRETVSTLVGLVDKSMVVAGPVAGTTRFRLLDTLREFALAELGEHGGGDEAAAARAAWIASITDTGLAAWMTRDGHARSVRLEREIENWRAAMRYAADRQDVELATRLCGSPTSLLLWHRPDLLDLAEDLAAGLDLPSTALAVIAYASWGRAWMDLDLDGLERACQRFDTACPDDTSGVRATIRSAAALASGDMAGAIAIRAAAIADPTIDSGGRDIATVITVYGACSAGLASIVTDEWRARTADLAHRSDVPTIRKVARVALAWLLVDTDPPASVRWLHEAVADPEPLPGFWARLTQTFVGRFLTRVSPERAAPHLLAVLPSDAADLGAADAVTLASAAELLASSGHPSSADVLATVASAFGTAYLSTLVTDLAQRLSDGRLLGRDQLVSVVRTALEQISGQASRAAAAPL